MTLGDRVVVMKDGVVQQVGEPMQLYAKPANRFVASFIGSPAMTSCSEPGAGVRRPMGRGARRAGEGPANKTRIPRAHAGGRVVLGVRPEALRIANGGDGPDYAIEATVEVSSRWGSEILLDVRAGEHPIVRRRSPTRVKVHGRYGSRSTRSACTSSTSSPKPRSELRNTRSRMRISTSGRRRLITTPGLSTSEPIAFRYGTTSKLRRRYLVEDYRADADGWRVAHGVYVEAEWDRAIRSAR